MKNYEIVIIVRSSMGDDEVTQLSNKVQQTIEKGGGTVLKNENWGKKKLAYEVAGEKRGTYLLFLVKGDGGFIKDLEHFSRVEDAVIRFLLVKSVVRKGKTGRPVVLPGSPVGNTVKEEVG